MISLNIKEELEMHLKGSNFHLALNILSGLYFSLLIISYDLSHNSFNLFNIIYHLIFLFGVLIYSWKKSVDSFGRMYFLQDLIHNRKVDQAYGGVTFISESYDEKNRDSKFDHIKMNGLTLRVILIFACIISLYIAGKYLIIPHSSLGSGIISIYLLIMLYNARIWTITFVNLFVGLGIFCFISDFKLIEVQVLGIIFLCLFIILHKLLIDFYYSKLTKSSYSINILSLSKKLFPQFFLLILSFLISMSFISPNYSLLDKIVKKLLAPVKMDVAEEVKSELKKIKPLQKIEIKNIEVDNLMEILETVLDMPLPADLLDNIDNSLKNMTPSDQLKMRKLRDEFHSTNQGIIEIKKSNISTQLKSIKINKLLESKNKIIEDMLKLNENYKMDHNDSIVLDKVNQELKNTNENISLKDINVMEAELKNMKGELESLELSAQSFSETQKKQIKENIKNIEKREEVIQKVKEKKEDSKLNKFIILVLGSLVILKLFYIFKSLIQKGHIISSRLEIDEELRSEIQNDLKAIPKKFKSFNEEILLKYKCYHKISEKLFYPNEFAPPAMILVDCFEDAELKKSAKALGIIFNNQEFARQKEFSRKEIRIFRKAFINFSNFVILNLENEEIIST